LQLKPDPLGSSAVDCLPVPNLDNLDREIGVIYRVNDPVVALANTVSFPVCGKLLASSRSRFIA
jgi:hypothetical protein